MNIATKNIPVTMSHPSLADAPSFPLPPGYAIPPLLPGRRTRVGPHSIGRRPVQ